MKGAKRVAPSFFVLGYLRPAFLPVPDSINVTAFDDVFTATDARRGPIAAGLKVMVTAHD